MSKIKIVTDTDCSLPEQIIKELGIYQVPIGIHINGESYSSGVDLNDHMLFEKTERLKCLPTTSAPSPADFIKCFQAAFEQGAEGILCVTVSSHISSTYGSALAASEHFPGREIRVIDSLNLSMAQGFMVMEAAEAAKKNISITEIVKEIELISQKYHTLAVLSSLKYLALSGRVDKYAAGLANAFNIKPILTIRDGKLILLEKIRTRKKAIERIMIMVKNKVENKEIKRLSVIHVDDLQSALEMESLLRITLACPEKIIIAEFSPGLSVHTGSGVVGVVVQTE